MASFKILLVAVGLVFTLGFIDASAIPDQLNRKYDIGDEKEETKREVLELLHRIQSLIVPDNNTDLQKENLECKCAEAGDLECACCHHFKISAFKLDKNCCLSIKYIKQDKVLLLTLRSGDLDLFSKKISVENPKCFCVDVPVLPGGASACIQLNLTIDPSSLRGCVSIQFRALSATVVDIKLGCFKLKFRGEMGAVNALELPTHDWIETQPDEAMPVFEEHIQATFQEVELK